MISPADRARLQTHLRARLRNPALTVDAPDTAGGTAQLHDGPDMIGTVDQVDEDGERSWAVTLIVLVEDLEG